MKTRTITVQVDDPTAKMLDALDAHYRGVATPTSIYRAAAKGGLIRLCVEFGIDPREFGFDNDDLQTAGVEIAGKTLAVAYPAARKR